MPSLRSWMRWLPNSDSSNCPVRAQANAPHPRLSPPAAEPPSRHTARSGCPIETPFPVAKGTRNFVGCDKGTDEVLENRPQVGDPETGVNRSRLLRRRHQAGDRHGHVAIRILGIQQRSPPQENLGLDDTRARALLRPDARRFHHLYRVAVEKWPRDKGAPRVPEVQRRLRIAVVHRPQFKKAGRIQPPGWTWGPMGLFFPDGLTPAGQSATGGSVSSIVTVKLQAAALPALSAVVHITTVAPLGKTDPGGRHARDGNRSIAHVRGRRVEHDDALQRPGSLPCTTSGGHTGTGGVVSCTVTATLHWTAALPSLTASCTRNTPVPETGRWA